MSPHFTGSIVRILVVGFGLVVLVGGAAAPAAGQWLVTDARRIGMGGLSLGRSGSLERYNPAYRAVDARADRRGQPKVTIPIPLGIIQFLHDHPHLSSDPAFDPKSTGFNPILVANTILNLPLYLEVKKAPTPTNDVAFTIGRNFLMVNLGQAATLVPEDQFGISGSSRPLDPGFGFKGFRVGVMGWLHDDVAFELGDRLLGFLRDSQPADTNTRYNVLVHGLVEGGFAPTVSYAGRIAGDSTHGFYAGGAVHYYLGLGYGRTDGDAGFITGDTIFAGSNPVTPDGRTLTQYSKPGNTLGHGIGGDIGVAWVSGPVEIGIGVNDIGATITWPDTRLDSAFYHDSTYSRPVANHVETKTKLPVSYVANLAYTVGNTTLGADVLNTGRGSVVHVGGEQRVGLFALRGGVARDQRKRIEFGFGGGLRFGGLGLDVGFWTHTNSLSNERGITMATSLSIY
ncbi:MAG: hypothetical protein DMD60_08090 [Gemmatimonadetes bacterium]|nr:MAG: hypothetical protein DMD60_08090 [Gemmatimonadota bacterium]